MRVLKWISKPLAVLGLSLNLSISFSFDGAWQSNSLVFAQPNSINSRICPLEFKDLSVAIAKDLPSYLTRTYARLKFKSQVVAVSIPELEPLPLTAGAISTQQPVNPLTEPRQMFVRLRERQAGRLDTTDKSYWLFISHTNRGWRLAMAFTRINNAPPQDVSDGAIASAVRTWLRDHCISQ